MSVNPQLRRRAKNVLAEVDEVFKAIKFAEGGAADGDTPIQDRLLLERAAGELGLDGDIVRTLSDEQLAEVLRVVQGIKNQGETANDFDESENSANNSMNGDTPARRALTYEQQQRQARSGTSGFADSAEYVAESYAKHQRPKVSEQSPNNSQPLPFSEVKRPDLRNSSPEGDFERSPEFLYALGLARQTKSADPVATAKKFCEQATADKNAREQRASAFKSLAGKSVGRAFQR